MSNQVEKDKLWRKIRELDQAIKIESVACKKRGEVTKAMRTLQSDYRKAQAEYAKANDQVAHNPMSVESNDRISNKIIFGGITGKTGHDTHHGG
jgi:hypothetical protein